MYSTLETGRAEERDKLRSANRRVIEPHNAYIVWNADYSEVWNSWEVLLHSVIEADGSTERARHIPIVHYSSES